MNDLIRRRIEMLERVESFAAAPALVPGPRAAALFSELTVRLELLRTLAGRQAFGRTGFRSATGERARVAVRLREQLADISAVAKALDPQLHPGVGAKFPMPRGSGYQPLLSAAYAFLESAEPLKQTFLAQDMPADFLEAVRASVERFHLLSDERNGGSQKQVGSTAALAEESRRAVRLVRELGSILLPRIRSNALLLAAWKAASHIESAPRRAGSDGPDVSGTAAAPEATPSEAAAATPAHPSAAATASVRGAEAVTDPAGPLRPLPPPSEHGAETPAFCLPAALHAAPFRLEPGMPPRGVAAGPARAGEACGREERRA